MAKEKCYYCKKKLPIISYTCRCENKYCQKCRMPENHNCTFDFKNYGKKELESNLTKIVANKVIRI